MNVNRQTSRLLSAVIGGSAVVAAGALVTAGGE